MTKYEYLSGQIAKIVEKLPLPAFEWHLSTLRHRLAALTVEEAGQEWTAWDLRLAIGVNALAGAILRHG